jgi:hypothetical protein
VLLIRARGRGRRSRIEMDNHIAHVWTYRGNKIVRMVVYPAPTAPPRQAHRAAHTRPGRCVPGAARARSRMSATSRSSLASATAACCLPCRAIAVSSAIASDRVATSASFRGPWSRERTYAARGWAPRCWSSTASFIGGQRHLDVALAVTHPSSRAKSHPNRCSGFLVP